MTRARIIEAVPPREEFWVSRNIVEKPEEPKKIRLDWDSYFLKIAQQVAARSTCDRKHVGALIVRERAILATGYNGSMRNSAHCDDVGHMMEEGHCVRTVHAEINAVAHAAKHGVNIEGASIYCTALPCWQCFKVLVNAGIYKIVYNEPYRESDHIALIKSTCFNLCVVLLQRDIVD